jgi:5-formaminoimidazole-4-carboxamide-1-beta-D-ribofuranosyl 5'-monophosphate synthetase
VLSSFQIADYVRKNGYKSCNSFNVRKVVNHIRRYAIIPCLASNGKGYFVASNDREITETIHSLEGRVDAIKEVIEALKEQRYIKYNI